MNPSAMPPSPMLEVPWQVPWRRVPDARAQLVRRREPLCASPVDLERDPAAGGGTPNAGLMPEDIPPQSPAQPESTRISGPSLMRGSIQASHIQHQLVRPRRPLEK